MSRISQSSSQLAISEAPFRSKEGADLVVRSSDRVLFFVRKHLLTGASPFFLNLLADGTPNETHEGFPVCPVSEDSLTIRAVLHLCYPNHIAPLAFLDTITLSKLISSLHKYIMEDAHDRLEHIVRDGCLSLTSPASGQTLIKTNPLRVFALARTLCLDDIVSLAVKEVLHIPLSQFEESPELEYISGRDYHRLVKYYTECGEAAANVISDRLVQEVCSLSAEEPPPSKPHLVWAGVHMHVPRSWVMAKHVASLQQTFRNQPMGKDIVAEPLIELMVGTCKAEYKEVQVNVEKALKALKEKMLLSIAKVNMLP